MASHASATRRAAAVLAATAALAATSATPAPADDSTGTQLASTDCQFGGKVIKGTPWSLQRVITEQLWDGESLQGQGQKVAVIDTGVDKKNPQLAGKVLAGDSLVKGKSSPTNDTVGHGTKVAGIIAAGQMKGTGFHGLAPKAKILPIQTSTKEEGGNLATMIKAIDTAVKSGAKVVNISQGTETDLSRSPELQPAVQSLQAAVARADRQGVLIVASAGNSGAKGKDTNTYPAALKNPNVLSVAASDRNNERAPFSTPNTHVDIAAPGVDMVSTVPSGGQCVDQGTSFSAPYAAGVAALLRQKHPGWSPARVIWHLEDTAARSHAYRDNNTGWGVIDPVAAIKDETAPTKQITDKDLAGTTSSNTGDKEKIVPATLALGETPEERNTRYATYLVIGGGLGLAVITAGAMARRDWKRRRGEDVL